MNTTPMDNIKNIKNFYKPDPEADLYLAPCPFCGNDEVVYGRYDTPMGERWLVFCTNCLASIDPGYAQQRHIVHDMWNKRYSEDVSFLESVIEQDCRRWEIVSNKDKLFHDRLYLRKNTDVRGNEIKEYSLMLNDGELYFGTLREINAIVKSMVYRIEYNDFRDKVSN